MLTVYRSDVFGTVDFVHPKMGEKVYRTCAEEAGLNVVQIGAADDVAAVQAATLVCVISAHLSCIRTCVPSSSFSACSVCWHAEPAIARASIATWVAQSASRCKEEWALRC